MQLPELIHKLQNIEVIRALTRKRLTMTLDGYLSMRHMHLKILTISIGPMRGSCLRSLINTHQLKSVKLKAKKPAFMNGELRRAIYKKHMLFNKYKKCKTSLNWDNYRRQRNLVTKIKKQSMRVYFYERCAGGPKSKDFWPTIKPFLSKKGSDGGNEVILCEK